MANRFYSPDQQFISNSGVPYAGGFLYFYATGTSTPLNTYSNSSLTIANTNPVVLDSNGQAGSIFLQNLAYKVVLADSNNNQIWTMDPVYTSDYSAFAQFQPYNGNPNGFVAGTAGTVGALPGTSAVWDYVDNILYVCTTTGNAASAVWTAINASAATPATPTPQGYLTLASDPSNPVPTVDIIGNAVYYTPYVGNLIPVFNGASFVTTNFSQLTLTLTASHAINTLYDCFVFSNSGVLTLVSGPAWANSGVGAGSRGTGPSTTQLQRLNGLWVNAVQITGRNGSTTYTIPANTATFVGTISIDSVAGQITCNRSYGQNRKWGVSNAYNRQTNVVQVGDATASWNYTSATIRQSNASASNNMLLLNCLPEEEIYCLFKQKVQYANSSNIPPGTTPNAIGAIGVGLNSTTTYSGTVGTLTFTFGLSSGNFSVTLIGMAVAEFVLAPTLGVNFLNTLESSGATNSTTTFFGTQANMALTATYRA